MPKIDAVQLGQAHETIRAIAQLRACPAWDSYYVRRCKEEKAIKEREILTDLSIPANDRQELVHELHSITVFMEMLDRDEHNAKLVIGQADREAKGEPSSESVL